MCQFFASNAPWPEFLIRLEQLVRCDEAGGVRHQTGMPILALTARVGIGPSLSHSSAGP